LEGALLQKYLPDVYFPLVTGAEHILCYILVATDVDVFGKCAYCALMEIGAVLLRNCY
jgi:hypothetical protein